MTRDVIEKIKHNHSLISIAFRNAVEPSDALSLLSSLPNIEKFTLRNVWEYTEKSILALELLDKMKTNVNNLCLDIPIKLQKKEDVDFLVRFLEFFSKIEFLQILIESDLEFSLPAPIFVAINQCKQLQELVLGLNIGLGPAIGQAIKEMKNITKLQKFSLTMKLAYAKAWKLDIQTAFSSTITLINKNKKLKAFDLYIEQLPPRLMPLMKEMVQALPFLDQFRFVYSPVALKHGKNHTQTLKELKRMFKNTNPSRRVLIQTSCEYYFGDSCDLWREDVEGVGKSIEYFSFSSEKRVQTPFFNCHL